MMRNSAAAAAVDLLSSSPTSVLVGDSSTAALKSRDDGSSSTLLHLEEFLEKLPNAIAEQSKTQTSHQQNDSENENGPIAKLMEKLVLDPNDIKSYAHFDSSRNYTRNLIHTDDETYTLLLLCWNPSKQSPIHNHPCDGCWMRVISGSVLERRYVKHEDSMKCVSDNVYKEGQFAYIQDSMGYHCVGSMGEPAMTLHLYCPPFRTCKIWLDPEHSSQSTSSVVCYYSEYGEVL